MKVMAKSKISGERQLQCLIAEKNIMLNDNPFLVHLHYSWQTPDKLFFVMDYIQGCVRVCGLMCVRERVKHVCVCV